MPSGWVFAFSVDTCLSARLLTAVKVNVSWDLRKLGWRNATCVRASSKLSESCD